MGELDVWYARLDVDETITRWQQDAKKAERRRLEKNLDKARNKGSLRALAKLTETVDGQLRIADRPPLLVPIDKLAEREGRDPAEISRNDRRTCSASTATRSTTRPQVLAERYRYVDAAHKVVGVGSVGTRAWIALLFGRDERRPALPAGQGSRAVGARAVRRGQPLQAPRPAGGRRPAADAGGRRHAARLVDRRGHRRQEARLLRAPALGRQGLGRGRDDEPRRRWPPTRALRLEPRPRPRPHRRPPRDRRLPRQGRQSSTARSSSSRRPTRIRTRPITRR